MKQVIIILVSILLLSPVFSAPAIYPLITTISSQPSELSAELREKRQDQTVTYTRNPLSISIDTGIPSITDSSVPSPTDTNLFPSTTTDSISIVPTSSWDGGTTIENTGTLTFGGGGTQTLTYGSETLTLTFPPTPVLSFAAEADLDGEKEKRQFFLWTEVGGSWTTESNLPVSTSWYNGGPVFSLTFPADVVRATGASDIQLADGHKERNMIEVIKRQVDTITWGGTLPVTTYWGDQTITIGGETITFGVGPGHTVKANEARITAAPEYTNEGVEKRRARVLDRR